MERTVLRSLLIVTHVQIESIVQLMGDFQFLTCLILLLLCCGDVGQCFLFLLMAVVLFTIRQKQDGEFLAAADLSQIRFSSFSVRLLQCIV